MIFIKTPLQDAFLIELEKRGDDRGFFARFFCHNEFSQQGLADRFVQINNSLSAKKGTLRGMHYQQGNSAEVKVVRCIRGSLWDCILDLRPNSPTYLKWYGAELSAENRLMMYVPQGFAHAIYTLENDTEALYLVNQFYNLKDERGIRWNDPKFQIAWPGAPVEISEKDTSWPDFDENYHSVESLKQYLKT